MVGKTKSTPCSASSATTTQGNVFGFEVPNPPPRLEQHHQALSRLETNQAIFSSLTTWRKRTETAQNRELQFLLILMLKIRFRSWGISRGQRQISTFANLSSCFFCFSFPTVFFLYWTQVAWYLQLVGHEMNSQAVLLVSLSF